MRKISFESEAYLMMSSDDMGLIYMNIADSESVGTLWNDTQTCGNLSYDNDVQGAFATLSRMKFTYPLDRQLVNGGGKIRFTYPLIDPKLELFGCTGSCY